MSFMVVRAGWANTGQALLELADVGADSEIRNNVRKAATKAISPILGNPDLASLPDDGLDQIEVRDVQGIKAGQNYLMEIELAVPESWTVRQTHIIEDAVRLKVGSTVRGVRRVKVRTVPKEGNVQDFTDEFIGAEVSPRSSPEPEEDAETKHDHHHRN